MPFFIRAAPEPICMMIKKFCNGLVKSRAAARLGDAASHISCNVYSRIGGREGLGDWQLDRLPDEVRQNAEYAAQCDGLPLHRWLGKLIRDTCAEEGVPLSRELLAIASNQPPAIRRHSAAPAPEPTFEPIVVVPGAGATERLPMVVRPAAAPGNGFAGDGHGSDTATADAIPVPPPGERQRQTEPWRQPLPRGSTPPALPPTTSPALRRQAEASGSYTMLTASMPAAPRALPPVASIPIAPPPYGFAAKPPPAPPQRRAAAATPPPAGMSFPLAASRSDDRLAALSTLVQRLRRNELSPIAEARQFVKLIGEHAAGISDIAFATGRTEEQVARSLRLLSLPEKERDMIDRGALSRASAFLLLDDAALDPTNPIAPARTRTP